jgi:cytochrome P450
VTGADLLAPEFVADPYPVLARLRAAEPVHWSEAVGGWLVTSYADVLATMKHPPVYSNEGRLGRSVDYLPAEKRAGLTAFADHYRTKGLLHADPPDHTRLRRLVLQAFSPRVVAGLRPRIEAIVADLLAAVRPAGRMEVIGDLAAALPVTVLTELLGVPRSDGAAMRRWADAILAFQGVNRPPEPVLLAAQAALVEARAYLADLLAHRRRSPGDDLVSLLAGGELSDAEIVNTGITFLTAGHETTTSLIGNGLWLLLAEPARWAALVADPGLIPTALEEIVRYESPVSRQPRRVARDAVLHGVGLKSGDMVFQMLNAANRDPAVFADPDRVDLARNPNKHLGFGHGVHFCVGAPLSRIEGEVALRALVEHAPGLRLPDPTPDWDLAKANSRVLRRLDVEF